MGVQIKRPTKMGGGYLTHSSILSTGRSSNDNEIIKYNEKNSPARLYTRIIPYTSHKSSGATDTSPYRVEEKVGRDGATGTVLHLM